MVCSYYEGGLFTSAAALCRSYRWRILLSVSGLLNRLFIERRRYNWHMFLSLQEGEERPCRREEEQWNWTGRAQTLRTARRTRALLTLGGRDTLCRRHYHAERNHTHEQTNKRRIIAGVWGYLDGTETLTPGSTDWLCCTTRFSFDYSSAQEWPRLLELEHSPIRRKGSSPFPATLYIYLHLIFLRTRFFSEIIVLEIL